jgi:phosphoribosyl 1,2-cyclic phosphodiesterase
MPKLITLFSGSSGNCHYIRSETTEILIDAGVSARSIENSLREIGTSIRNISAIFVTHEHSDHVRGLEVIAKKFGTPVHMTEISARELIKDENAALLRVLALHPPRFSVTVGDITVSSFITPHDSACCVGYRAEFPLGDCTHKIGVATDIGHVESDLIDALYGVDECIIESNHDVSMLMTGPYPYMLKRRILSPNGHLSNDDCGKLLGILAESGTHAFMLAHLSKENNYPPTAELTAKAALAKYPNIRIAVASPSTPTEIFI